jgi:hypothetical protein
MKKLVLLFVIIIISVSVHAQSEPYKPELRISNDTIFIDNDTLTSKSIYADSIYQGYQGYYDIRYLYCEGDTLFEYITNNKDTIYAYNQDTFTSFCKALWIWVPNVYMKFLRNDSLEIYYDTGQKTIGVYGFMCDDYMMISWMFRFRPYRIADKAEYVYFELLYQMSYAYRRGDLWDH